VEEENYDSPYSGSTYFFFFRQQLLIKAKFSPKSQKSSGEEESLAQTGSAEFEKKLKIFKVVNSVENNQPQ
jgi:hypothetical protein